jgi:hypothetical protein
LERSQPGTLFESFIPDVEAARELGVLADSVAPDIALPMDAARDLADVADVAVAELLQPKPEPIAIREVLGPRDQTHPDVAATFGLPYNALPYDEDRGGTRRRRPVRRRRPPPRLT